MPISIKKVRFAASAPGLLLWAVPIVAAGALTACDAGPQGKPAAEVELLDTRTPPPSLETTPTPLAPGFDSVAEAPARAASRTATGEQQVRGTIVDFVCEPNAPVGEPGSAQPAPCDLIIRTETRGDRRILCTIAPCDAWAKRGGLPQGIRGLNADASVLLIDTFDANGAPTGRVANATRLNVAYTAAKAP